MWHTWRVLNLLVKTSGIIKLGIEQVHSEFSLNFKLVRNLPGLFYFPWGKKKTQKNKKTHKTPTNKPKNPPATKQKTSFMKAVGDLERVNDNMRNVYLKMPVLILNTFKSVSFFLEFIEFCKSLESVWLFQIKCLKLSCVQGRCQSSI